MRAARKRFPILIAVALLLLIAHWMWRDPERREALVLILYLLFQLAFAILFMIVQFVALFWFLSRVKINVYLPDEPGSLTMQDYFGNEHLVRLVGQWIELIRNRERFLGMGGRPIRGILLAGPPGVGKTYLIRCMGGSAGIPVVAMEASTIRGMFWGMDVLRVMWFFRKARKLAREYGACIAFIDEIDAIGMSRGGVMGGSAIGPGGLFGWGGSGALTRLLYELDGIEDPPLSFRARNLFRRLFGLPPLPYLDWVIIVGATNRPDVLDPALLRPGRLDRRIYIDLPDRTDRRAIITGYLRKIRSNISSEEIEKIVEETKGVSPACIASIIMKDAVRIAILRGSEMVELSDVLTAIEEARFGEKNPIREMEERQRRQVAIHEAGHAVFTIHLLPGERIIKASIIRRSGVQEALGFVHHEPIHDTYALPLRELALRVLIALGGHVAVEEILGEPWSGALSDFRYARNVARLLTEHNFFGTMADPEGEDARRAEKEWIEKMMEAARRMAKAWRQEIIAVADALLEKGELSHEEIEKIIETTSGHAV